MVPRHTYLQSVVICYANIRVCCAIVPENKFSSHRPPIPTIFDCNNLHAVCTRLLPPFESVTIWRIWGKWPCKTNGWTIVPKNLFSAIIHQRQKIAIAIIADQRQLCHTATDWTTSAPSTKKKRSPYELLLLYPEPCLKCEIVSNLATSLTGVCRVVI